MKVLLDQNMPTKLRRFLPGNLVFTAYQMKWDRLENGYLLQAAEIAEFQVMVTGDKSVEKQQNNEKRIIALVYLTLTDRDLVRNHVEDINAAIQRASKGTFEKVEIKRPPKEARMVVKS